MKLSRSNFSSPVLLVCREEIWTHTRTSAACKVKRIFLSEALTRLADERRGVVTKKTKTTRAVKAKGCRHVFAFFGIYWILLEEHYTVYILFTLYTFYLFCMIIIFPIFPCNYIECFLIYYFFLTSFNVPSTEECFRPTFLLSDMVSLTTDGLKGFG